MTIEAYAVVDGRNRVVRVERFQFSAERHAKILSGTKANLKPYRVVLLTGEVERHEGKR